MDNAEYAPRQELTDAHSNTSARLVDMDQRHTSPGHPATGSPLARFCRSLAGRNGGVRAAHAWLAVGFVLIVAWFVPVGVQLVAFLALGATLLLVAGLGSRHRARIVLLVGLAVAVVSFIYVWWASVVGAEDDSLTTLPAGSQFGGVALLVLAVSILTIVTVAARSVAQAIKESKPEHLP